MVEVEKRVPLFLSLSLHFSFCSGLSTTQDDYYTESSSLPVSWAPSPLFLELSMTILFFTAWNTSLLAVEVDTLWQTAPEVSSLSTIPMQELRQQLSASHPVIAFCVNNSFLSFSTRFTLDSITIRGRSPTRENWSGCRSLGTMLWQL